MEILPLDPATADDRTGAAWHRLDAVVSREDEPDAINTAMGFRPHRRYTEYQVPVAAALERTTP